MGSCFLGIHEKGPSVCWTGRFATTLFKRCSKPSWTSYRTCIRPRYVTFPFHTHSQRASHILDTTVFSVVFRLFVPLCLRVSVPPSSPRPRQRQPHPRPHQ